MILNKWNYEKHDYEDYEIPDEWNCKTYSTDMEIPVNCPHCGRLVKYGDMYTSSEIHDEIGFGYAVCEKCYEEEIKRRKLWKK